MVTMVTIVTMVTLVTMVTMVTITMVTMVTMIIGYAGYYGYYGYWLLSYHSGKGPITDCTSSTVDFEVIITRLISDFTLGTSRLYS